MPYRTTVVSSVSITGPQVESRFRVPTNESPLWDGAEAGGHRSCKETIGLGFGAHRRAQYVACLQIDELSSAGLKAELRLPVCFFAQSQVRLEGFSLLGNEAFEYASFAFRAERLDLFRGKGLLRNGFVDAEVAALAVAAAAVEVLSIGLFDGALLAFRARERSGRRSRACLCRR